VVSDRVMGLGGLLVAGTMRDSLFILDALHRLDAQEQPEILTTDTASYSDIVFGLFAICGYQFAPRIADISDAQQWWIDPADVGLADTRTSPSANGYGRLNELNLRRVNIAAIKQHWPAMLQVARSLVTNQLPWWIGWRAAGNTPLLFRASHSDRRRGCDPNVQEPGAGLHL
jgi:TnpA family transposase